VTSARAQLTPHGYRVVAADQRSQHTAAPALQQDMAYPLRAREVVPPGAGHSAAIDDPVLIAKTLASFWRTA
jgi:pimeloyl-ACP methyl ester carboxylesterase